ncbi:MAG TPA: hypothetical protein VMY77_00445 [Chitinophagaceae bacterium]|nr:hypothetical protein [Chitinophagaceae bacterium]
MQKIEMASPWPLWRKIIFRFFFIYILSQVVPWWVNAIPGANLFSKYYNSVVEWMVDIANANLFHVREILVPLNGSGDTSYGWAHQWTMLSLALLICIVWSLIDIRRSNYRVLNYWLCLVIRYFIALVAFLYGFDKILLLQMPFPSQSYLATSLGDFLPMRLSWNFIGYSPSYQFFSGLMECLAGLLLLYRRTATLGILMATAVFVNVMMLNLSYDIPVKLFSMNMVLICLFMLANEYRRIACFFILNKPATVCSIYDFTYKKKWIRITRIILKIGFLYVIVMMFYDTYDYYKTLRLEGDVKPIKNNSIYIVTKYAVNKDTLPPLLTDSARWQDVIFDKGGMGSIKTTDTIFRRRYGRGYFLFTADTIKQMLNLKKFQQDTSFILSLHYQMPDSNTILLWGKKQNDSLFVELKKSNRYFQLAEKQFHWLSEANR